MITKFPKGFEERIQAIREKWLKIGLSTDPVQRPAIEAALAKMYAKAGKPKPGTVFILRSPREVFLALALLRSKSAKIFTPELSAQLSDQLSAQLRDQLSAQLRAQLSAQLRDQLSAQLSDQLSDQLSAQLSDQLRDQLSAQLSDQLSAQLREDALAEIRSTWWWMDFGQFDAWWCSYYDAGMQAIGADANLLNELFEFTAAAGWSYLFPEWAFVSERPTVIHRDPQNRLHCESGPACAYPDGFAVYAVHGVRVPQDVIENPASITVERIERETNAEIRRVMIERYGQARYLLDAGAVKIHEDEYGTLFRKVMNGDEPIVMVKVVNSTAEPDGSFKDYFLRVPPSMETARAAVAWTFGKEEKDYAPALQT